MSYDETCAGVLRAPRLPARLLLFHPDIARRKCATWHTPLPPRLDESRAFVRGMRFALSPACERHYGRRPSRRWQQVRSLLRRAPAAWQTTWMAAGAPTPMAAGALTRMAGALTPMAAAMRDQRARRYRVASPSPPPCATTVATGAIVETAHGSARRSRATLARRRVLPLLRSRASARTKGCRALTAIAAASSACACITRGNARPRPAFLRLARARRRLRARSARRTSA